MPTDSTPLVRRQKSQERSGVTVAGASVAQVDASKELDDPIGGRGEELVLHVARGARRGVAGVAVGGETLERVEGEVVL
eukprot:11196058-Lingulodinium_polyedra.AAC.1